MPATNFVNQEYYHLYNRGVAKRKIFSSFRDSDHLLTTFAYYLEQSPKTRLSEASKDKLKFINTINPDKPQIEILCFCLMPNHFHLLVKQLIDNGISTFMRRALNSYTKYYNLKHSRVGPLFQGIFKAVLVENDEQILHLSRYIHLNPFAAKITNDSQKYLWSSYQYYQENKKVRLCNPNFLIKLAGSIKEYADFVKDYAQYIQSLEELNKLLIDIE